MAACVAATAFDGAIVIQATTMSAQQETKAAEALDENSFFEDFGDTQDEEIDSISSFDLVSQRRDAALDKIYLSPAREVLFGSCEETVAALRAAVKKARGKRRAALEAAMAPDLAQLDAGQMPEAMDKYYGIRYPAPATVLDHLDSPILILDEMGGIRDALKAAAKDRGVSKSELYKFTIREKE